MASVTPPFVLLDDARPGGKARLYADPVRIVEARDHEEVSACLDALRCADGLHVAGFLSYEAGFALEAKLAPLRAPLPAGAPPLAWFGLFESYEEGDADRFLPDPAGAWLSPPRPLIGQAEYEASVAQVMRHIEAGNVYQANLTFQAEVRIAGHPLAAYASVRRQAGAGHGGVVLTGEHWILSFSPELFFTLHEGRITTRPMKGTARRGGNEEQDDAAVQTLVADPKQRAENLMIVDLLRNDLSRVSRVGSVKAPTLFAVETYPTVHQMTSTVTAVLERGVGAVDVVETIFPCGSVTGAPKIRAMEVINEVEQSRRGVYTGAIGRIAPDGGAEFNVAIRTLTLRAGETVARLGLGSGIVADSRPVDEWGECLAKGAFVNRNRRFDLFETMHFDPRDGLADFEAHLERMKRSADALGFTFDRHQARNELQAATFGLSGASKVRLMLSPSGAFAIEIGPLEPSPSEPVDVALAPLPVAPHDFRLAHKTTDRGFYDAPRKASGAFEILFTDPAGFLTEGSFTSLFVERGGGLLTPPLSRGLLPGILRARFIAEARAMEADLVAADLVGGFLIGNSLRGLIRARLRPAGSGA